MDTKIERNEIIRYFSGGVHCSQVVIKQWAEEVGLDEETAMRMAAPFGGGCMGGDICGCVTAALMLIGVEFGHCEVGDLEGNERVTEKTAEFRQKFTEKCGSVVCRELIGYDFSKEEDQIEASESRAVFKRCPDYVNCALEILDGMLG